ncbi:MAG: PKD domain-containing protein, partial [Thermoplasmata archaeon]|nr:PKD domain-containing protein [Thermoplasmata archaeon]
VLYQFSLRSLTGGNMSSMAFVTAKPLKGGPRVVPPNAPANWESLAITGSAPSARLGAAFSENPSDGSDLLFGGATSTGGFLGDTWEYVGGKWTQITGTAPSARAYAALAYDAKDQLLVLFGGRSTSGYLSDTWTFSGGKWANLTTTLGTAGSPPARAYAALVEDSAASFLLLFGGRNSTSALSDTWTFVASKWTPLSLTTHPASRSAAAAAYDALDKEVLLYGGNSSAGAALNDTWRFSSGAWSQVLLGTNPGGRIAASAVFDARDGYLLLFGGKSALGYAHGTWTFAGGAWKTITPGTTPVLRIYAAATYDEIRQSVLWGFGQSSSAVRSDLWAYSDPLNLWPTAAPTYGLVPMTVGFAPYVTGGIGPLSYLWNFGDGQNATLQFPSHIYKVVGYYNATLTVTDAVGLHVGASIPVHVMGDLSVGVSASTPSSNGTVKFTSTVGGGWHPYSYQWNFGDGKGSSTLADPTYRYALHLSYRATVTVTDAEGDVALASIGIVVPMPLPTAVSANVTEGSAPLAVAFALPEAAAPGVYLFEFGDGTQGFSMSGVVHTFTAPGAYRTIAILTGPGGGVEYVAPTIQVLTPLSLSVDVPMLALATGTRVDLSAAVAGGLAPYQVTWLLPDGTTLAGAQVASAFSEPGAFAVEVIVADSTGSVVSEEFTVRVLPVATPIVGSFSAEPMTVVASGAAGAAPILVPPMAPPSSAAYALARWTTTPAREQQRPTCSPSSVETTSKVVP